MATEMATELEYMDEINLALQGIFEAAIDARDKAQIAAENVTALKRQLLERRLAIQTVQLAELRQAK